MGQGVVLSHRQAQGLARVASVSTAPTGPYRQDAVAVLAPTVPATQHHPGLPEVGACGSLRGKQEIVWEEVMGDGECQVDGRQKIQVPVDADAADVAGSHGVFKNLAGEKDHQCPGLGDLLWGQLLRGLTTSAQ